jgi:UDP:flavonoid glycosyltransferase YjiC (YdhE family)
LFLARLDRGSPHYTLTELRNYVRDDWRLLAEIKPDIVVGDFRVSMSLSAELSGIPYFALSNLHWSPDAHLPTPVPEHPLVNLFGVRLSRWLSGRLTPLFLRAQVRAMNRLRHWYGLEEIGGRGAPEMYTHGTRTLYLDVPELYEPLTLRNNEQCLGPILWTPPHPLPLWWDDLPKHKPSVWVSAGSSGDNAATEMAASALIRAGLTVLLSTTGRLHPPAGAYAAEFIPGLIAAKRVDLVVGNGGSGLVYQALACGKPVLGLPRNIDQYYVMEAAERKGVGRLLRSGTATSRDVVKTVSAALSDSTLRANAEKFAKIIAAYSPVQKLERIIRSTTKKQEASDLFQKRSRQQPKYKTVGGIESALTVGGKR